MSDINIKGAREHNLREISLSIPRNRLICFTGVSGSGKSSLAFDTLYAEGQRRYIESLSSYARQFLDQLPKPDVELITGLSPAISISQKTGGQNTRSTVGTITEIYDYLRVLFARVATGYCPECGRPITAQTRDQILSRLQAFPEGSTITLLAPVIRGQKGEYKNLFDDLKKQGYIRARVDGSIIRLDDEIQLDRKIKHNIDVIIDRVTITSSGFHRMAESVEQALKLGNGQIIVLDGKDEQKIKQKSLHEMLENDMESMDFDESDTTELDNSTSVSETEELIESKPKPEPEPETEPEAELETHFHELSFSTEYACPHCNRSFESPSPQMFSFNNPRGMCPHCQGLGVIYTIDPDLLIPDKTRSFQQGAILLIEKWKDMGRWKRHIYQGVADSLAKLYGLERSDILEKAWDEMDERVRQSLLWGTGDLHITYTWRNGPNGHKWGGTFEGIIPRFTKQYHESNNKMFRAMMEKYMNIIPCGYCDGKRLNEQASAFRLETLSDSKIFKEKKIFSLPELCELPATDLLIFFSTIKLGETAQIVAAELLKEIRIRLQFLINVGLDYLSLGRSAPTLSGGEMQRIRLAGQIGSGLTGVLYVLDEPSIGLHPRDNDRLIETLTHLRDLGNTVVVVEHDEDTMLAADYLVDFGPGPGTLGGNIVAQGTLNDIFKKRFPHSITRQYLLGKDEISVPEERKQPNEKKLIVRNAAHNNLKGIDVEIPLGLFVCITGVSGSGKSSLVNDIIVEALMRDLNHGKGTPGKHDAIEGLEHLDKLIAIDQSPIGRTPRSNPSTYIKLFDDIRKLFSELPDSRLKGFTPGRFSFNVTGGRCESCEGNGARKLEMDFLPDIWVTCPVCEGKRFNRDTLSVTFKGKSIDQILDMEVQDALVHFKNIPKIYQKLKTLSDVGLGYMKLGQPSPTLSGGEAQRIKLARELVKKSTGKTLYLLDEPTTGLHFADIKLLLQVLHNFVDAGNTVLVVEHNLSVVKMADWVIDLGPEGGNGGGQIVAQGTPEDIMACPESRTGVALRHFIEMKRGLPTLKQKNQHPYQDPTESENVIVVKDAQEHNLKGVSAIIPRNKMTVCCGPSGSGKSSFAMDTIYAEGQRRYVESLSSYARQFLGQMQKPKVGLISGTAPSIAIDQKTAGHSPRSTVGTVTEIHDYMRILFARLGVPWCPDCDIPIGTQTTDEIIARILLYPNDSRLLIAAPINYESGIDYEKRLAKYQSMGFLRVRIDGNTYSLNELPPIDRKRVHLVELIIDRIHLKNTAEKNSLRGRIAGDVETALDISGGTLHIIQADDEIQESDWKTEVLSRHFSCEKCGRGFEPLTPIHFSFNSKLGWCPHCEGLGVEQGTSTADLIRDPKLTLEQGVLLLWSDESDFWSPPMRRAFSRETGIPLNVPFEQLDARFRRILFHGTGDRWFTVQQRDLTDKPVTGKKKEGAGSDLELFRFQFKGMYPAMEEAIRLVPAFRGKIEFQMEEVECTVCMGSRLRDDVAAVRLHDQTMDQLSRKPLVDLLHFFEDWKPNAMERQVAGDIIPEVRQRLQFLVDVGLDYLTLARSAPTLSGGESQRIRLAAQIGSGLTGVLYVLDEPTIGLHSRDNHRLISTLEKLRDLGNTLLLVEHDREIIENADYLIDFGPHAGSDGGNIVAAGTPQEIIMNKDSVTGAYLAGRRQIPTPSNRRILCSQDLEVLKEKRGKKSNLSASELQRRREYQELEERHIRSNIEGLYSSPLPVWNPGWLLIRGARHNNLKSIDVPIPLSAFTVISGVSGSGKSSLVEDILYKELARKLNRAQEVPGKFDDLIGIEQVNKVIEVDQKPIGQTPTSNPATYTGVFDLIRQLYAQLPEAKIRGYTSRRFSFNLPGGRCEKCEGAGQIKIEMHFLADVWVTCDSCNGKRYEQQTLEVLYRGKSIADVLEMSCREALEHFSNIPAIARVLRMLCDVGLDYVALGQSATTLSGGEAQRVKLAAELSRPDTGRTVYILDEPTTGLHFEDLTHLLDVLHRLVDLGNTVVVIEHNMEVLKSADWIIDIGPEAGLDGGHLVYAGTPEQLADYGNKWLKAGVKVQKSLYRSYTAEALIPLLANATRTERQLLDKTAFEKDLQNATKTEELINENEIIKTMLMPWETDGRRWHTHDRVSRTGTPCRWDGRILARIIDHIEESNIFAPTDWNNRTIVEIRADKKSLGWFLHAITGEEWLLKVKFRTARNTFKKDLLVQQLNLRPLNEMDDIPLYGTHQRVKVDIVGHWQEIELKICTYEEFDRPEFWNFLELAMKGFGDLIEQAKENNIDLTPWKTLGEQWHMSPGNCYGGSDKPRWPIQLLKKLVACITTISPDLKPVWTNKMMVPFCKSSTDRPSCILFTKNCEFLGLQINVPKRSVPLGRILDLGTDPEVDGTNTDFDAIQLHFRTEKDYDEKKLTVILQEFL